MRGDTLTEFCRLAERAGLFVSRYENYDSLIWDLHIKVSVFSKVPKHSEMYQTGLKYVKKKNHNYTFCYVYPVYVSKYKRGVERFIQWQFKVLHTRKK